MRAALEPGGGSPYSRGVDSQVVGAAAVAGPLAGAYTRPLSAQPEPFLTQNTPEYPLTPLENPPNTPCVQLLTHSKRLR